MLPYFAALQAQVEMSAGNAAQATRLLQGAQDDIERTNERWFAAEVLRLQGEAALQSRVKRGERAADCFRAALATARAQGARFWELRAAIGLARLDGEAGAREQRAEILAGFAEGYSLPDIKAAHLLAGTPKSPAA
jgi:predicted ATPase